MTVLVQTFALHNLLPLIHQGTLNLSTQIPDVETQPRTYIAENGLKPNMLLDAPWERWIQNSSINQLTPDRQFFLGVGLMLLNAPSVVRTGSFARQVQGWQIAVIDLQTHVLISETPGRVVKQRKVSRQHSSAHDIQPTEIVNSHTPPVDAAYEVESTSASNPITSREERLGLNLTNLEPRETSRAKDAAFTAKVETFPSNIPEISGSELRSALTDTAAVTHVDLTEIDKEQSTIIETVPLVEMDQNPILERNEHPSLMHREMETLLENVESIEIEIESQFGPVFYFINLGLHLELYGDFTTPLQPGIELPIWDFVALVAQQVLGDQVVHDPVWSLLTRLAGRREEDPPGLYFDPPGHESLESWLEEFMFSVHPRLQSALGVNKEELPSSFMQPARILVTTTHLDVYFSLADLPIEIRLSGLDRDPGWVPAAGKFIGFHYE
jgi:hypothetical protein